MRLFPITLIAAVAVITAVTLTGTLPADTKMKESWTILSLEGSQFKPTFPLNGENDSQASFQRQLLRVQWRTNDSIDIFVVTPKLVAKPPVILYLYNYATNTDRFMHTNVCQYLTRNGFAAVGFSLALSGHRFHDRGANEWFVSDLQEALVTSAHDVQLAINYLETRKDIDTSRIGVFGQGSGAAVAILAASVDPRIKVLDLEDAWGDWPDFIAKSTLIPEAERPAYLKPDFLRKVAELDPMNYLSKLMIPVRSQYSLAKSPVPPDVRKRMNSALPPQAAHIPVNGSFDWIQAQLKATGK